MTRMTSRTVSERVCNIFQLNLTLVSRLISAECGVRARCKKTCVTRPLLSDAVSFSAEDVRAHTCMHACTRQSFCCASVSLCLDALLPSLECSSPLRHHAFGGGEHLARSRHHPCRSTLLPLCGGRATVLHPVGGGAHWRAEARRSGVLHAERSMEGRQADDAGGLARMHVERADESIPCRS